MLIMLIAALALPAPAQARGQQAPPAAAARTAPDSDQTVPAPKGARLRLNNNAGEIIVRGWDRAEVRVQARHSSSTNVRVRSTPAAISISASASRGMPGGVDYEISVPRWMPVDLGGMGAYIQVDDLDADVRAETLHGDVVLRGVSGAIVASSVQGEVSIERARGRIEANAVTRGVTISDATGDIVVESVSGGVRLSAIRSRNVDVSGISGGITFSGEFAADGSYRFMSHSGGITIVTPSLDATLTVRGYSGGFVSAFPGEQVGTPRRGQAATHVIGTGQARVTLETFSGSVRIRRADK
ncbi:MAG: hypothetical protein H0X67_08960 [Acidobacteria bacterium]|nr:hypothetical protein [Acidobacteriota bacterium]